MSTVLPRFYHVQVIVQSIATPLSLRSRDRSLQTMLRPP